MTLYCLLMVLLYHQYHGSAILGTAFHPSPQSLQTNRQATKLGYHHVFT